MKRHFQEQLNFLEKSATEFDNGDESEAKRMATHLRTLLHNTVKSTSLLQHLNLLHTKFFDSSFNYDPGITSFCSLIVIDVTNLKYQPFLDDSSESNKNISIDFENWWSKNPVFIDLNKNEFTRKDIILFLTNKDGGAHVDTMAEEKFVKFSRQNSIGWNFVKNGNEIKVRGADIAAIRQITHEVLKTFIHNYTKTRDVHGVEFASISIEEVE